MRKSLSLYLFWVLCLSVPIEGMRDPLVPITTGSGFDSTWADEASTPSESDSSYDSDENYTPSYTSDITQISPSQPQKRDRLSHPASNKFARETRDSLLIPLSVHTTTGYNWNASKIMGDMSQKLDSVDSGKKELGQAAAESALDLVSAAISDSLLPKTTKGIAKATGSVIKDATKIIFKKKKPTKKIGSIQKEPFPITREDILDELDKVEAEIDDAFDEQSPAAIEPTATTGKSKKPIFSKEIQKLAWKASCALIIPATLHFTAGIDWKLSSNIGKTLLRLQKFYTGKKRITPESAVEAALDFVPDVITNAWDLSDTQKGITKSATKIVKKTTTKKNTKKEQQITKQLEEAYTEKPAPLGHWRAADEPEAPLRRRSIEHSLEERD